MVIVAYTSLIPNALGWGLVQNVGYGDFRLINMIKTLLLLGASVFH